jgi:hypothetical protein
MLVTSNNFGVRGQTAALWICWCFGTTSIQSGVALRWPPHSNEFQGCDFQKHKLKFEL